MKHLNVSLRAAVAAAVFGAHAIDATKVLSAAASTPFNGAPFYEPKELDPLPEPVEDMERADMTVTRLAPAEKESITGPAHLCDDGNMADKNRCLSVGDRNCMFVRLASDTSENSYCTPCELDGEELPCYNLGAWVGGFQVVECEMSCRHQKKVMQPQYSCTDSMGMDSMHSCFDRGTKSNSKCMFLQYADTQDSQKSSCAPCEVMGVGSIACPEIGSKGPEDKTTITGCFSQCEDADAMALAGLSISSPGVARTEGEPDAMVSAPVLPAMPPYENKGSAKMPEVGTDAGAPLDGFFPMVVYRSPKDYEAVQPTPLSSTILQEWPVQLPGAEAASDAGKESSRLRR